MTRAPAFPQSEQGACQAEQSAEAPQGPGGAEASPGAHLGPCCRHDSRAAPSKFKHECSVGDLSFIATVDPAGVSSLSGREGMLLAGTVSIGSPLQNSQFPYILLLRFSSYWSILINDFIVLQLKTFSKAVF